MTTDRPPIPAQVRRAVLRRARHRCEDCGADERLELHHLRYGLQPADVRAGAVPIFGSESAEDLAALCRGCHHERHVDPDGRFWIDPQDMAAHWAARQARQL